MAIKLKKRVLSLKNRLINNINRPEMRILPGQLAFFLLLTLIPLTALLGNVISLLDLPYHSISDVLNEFFPKGTAGLLDIISVKIDLNFNLLIFFISSLFLASNLTHSMIVASNQIYMINDRSYINRRLKALLMLLVVIILLIFMLFIPVFGDMIFESIKFIDTTSKLRSILVVGYRILKYPLSIVFIYFLIKVLYIMAPDKKIDRKNVIYGSLFTSVSWVVLTQIYSVYVENFTNYTTFYGGVSSILTLMLWLYLLSYIFVLGMALNVTKYEMDSNKTF